MRDVNTGKLYFSKKARADLGPMFAKAGYDIRKVRTLEQALDAVTSSLSAEVLGKLRDAMEIRRREIEQEKTG